MADSRGVSVSELVRELIEIGLTGQNRPAADTISGDLSERLDELKELAVKTTRAAAKAQFIASLSLGFASDLAKLTIAGQLPTSEEKTQFLEQTNEWAEGFASKYVEQG
jgi:hypothetical protein